MSDKATILVVEDERAQRDVLDRHLTRAGFAVDAVESGEEALARLRQNRFAALVTDLQLPGIDGLELIRNARDLDEEMPSVVMTGHGSMETAVEALRVGAHDYILKPLFFDELARKLGALLQRQELIRENARLRRALDETPRSEIVGQSEQTVELREWIARAAQSSSTVLITGDTGTGKELVARAIHALGPHGDEPLLAINVAALPENMVESELFGHEKGAFTGAQKRREGILRAAGSGTVFLDEIGEMPLPLQAKLLRALEVGEILPLGYDRPVYFAARILCATHRDLRMCVESGEFREDLYYRLNVLQVHVPPLRERPEDIPPLAHHLLGLRCEKSGIQPPVLTADAIEILSGYRWPGNVRELANVLERALFLADEGRIEPRHLPLEADQIGERSVSLKDAVDDFERRHIAMVLRVCDGNRERAAKELGLSQATLYRRLEKLGLKGDKAERMRR